MPAMPRGLGGLGVVALELLVAAVAVAREGEVRPVRCFDDSVDHHAVEQELLQRNLFHELLGLDDLLDGDVATFGGHAVEVVEVGVHAW